MTPDTPLSRLRAGLDEDERIARAAFIGHAPESSQWRVDGMQVWTHIGPHHTLVVKHTWPYEAAHMVNHDPARVLRQVEAIRKVLSTREQANRILRESQGLVGSSSSQTYWEGYQDACDVIIAALASLYPDPTEAGDTR